MAFRHVRHVGRVLAAAALADMGGDPLALVEDLHRARRGAHLHLLANEAVRDGEIMAVDVDMVVERHPADLPLRIDVGLGR